MQNNTILYNEPLVSIRATLQSSFQAVTPVNSILQILPSKYFRATRKSCLCESHPTIKSVQPLLLTHGLQTHDGRLLCGHCALTVIVEKSRGEVSLEYYCLDSILEHRKMKSGQLESLDRLLYKSMFPQEFLNQSN